jgi:hypothetical protein
LCDTSGIAWNAYHQPPMNTLILIGENNRILEVHSLGNWKMMVDKAKAMALGNYDEWIENRFKVTEGLQRIAQELKK